MLQYKVTIYTLYIYWTTAALEHRVKDQVTAELFIYWASIELYHPDEVQFYATTTVIKGLKYFIPILYQSVLSGSVVRLSPHCWGSALRDFTAAKENQTREEAEDLVSEVNI